MKTREEEFDVIHIGSGIGGLSCAAALAVCGYKVLVLEKSPFLGGAMSTFTEPETGNWSWSPGIQWVCDYSENSVDYMLLQTITGGKVSFSSLDDQYKIFPDLGYRFTFINNKETLLIKMKLEFPDESEGIERYFHYLGILEKKSGLFSLPKMYPSAIARCMFWFSRTFRLLPHMDKSVTEVLDSVLKIKNERLRAVLLSFSHCFGIPLSETPFPFYAYAQNAQFKGMYFPNGGGQAVIDALVDQIKLHGGDVQHSSGVKKIVFDNGRAVGVELDGGTTLYSGCVVSSIGIKETLRGLVPEHLYPPKLIKTLATRRSVPSFLLLLIGLEGDIASYGVKRSVYKTVIGDPSTISRDPTESGWECDDLTITFPSLLDKKHQDLNHHTVEIHHETQYRYFERFEGAKNSDKYKRITDQIRQHYLKRFEKTFPGISERIKYTKLITPLDIKKMTHHDSGSIFGLDIQKADTPELSPRSGIKNLYFTGQDIFAQGLTPLNGVLTASVVTGKNLIKRFKKEYNERYRA